MLSWVTNPISTKSPKSEKEMEYIERKVRNKRGGTQDTTPIVTFEA